MDKFVRRPFWVLALACSSLFYLPLGLRALWDVDEGRTAEIAREMLELNDWITPHLNYAIHLEKPPLMYWVTALNLGIFGATEFAVRFGPATFGLLTVWATYRLGKNWKNERLGLLAGGLLATNLLFFAFTQYLTYAMALTFWTTLTLLAGSGLLVERSLPRARRLLYAAALGIAGGLLTQGFIAVVLPLAAWLTVFLSQRRRLPQPRLPLKGALLVGALVAAPWFIAVSLKNPVFPYTYVLQELQRYLVGLPPHQEPFYFFIPVLLVGFLPWVVFLPKVIYAWVTHRYAAIKRDPEGALLISWVVWVVLFFSISQTKQIGDILPVFPALSLLTAHAFESVLPSEAGMPSWVGRGIAALIAVFIVLLLVLKLPSDFVAFGSPELKNVFSQSGILAMVLGLGVFLFVGVWGMRQTLACVGGVVVAQVLLLTTLASLAPDLDFYHSTRPLADRFLARAQAGNSITAYGVSCETEFPTLPFYLKRPIPDAQDPMAMPLGFWGVTTADQWPGLRAANAFDPVYVSGNLQLFRRSH